jgi:hypothetical protein
MIRKAVSICKWLKADLPRNAPRSISQSRSLIFSNVGYAMMEAEAEQ